MRVHDGWKPSWANTHCRQARCNSQHLRELTDLEDQYQQAWAKELKGVLREMTAATDQARAQGATRLPQPARDAFGARYDALLATGLAADPPPARGPRRRGRRQHTPARNLLERLLLGKAQVLAFLDDLTIPFANNQAERDLRLLTVQQKVSGCFRAATGSAAFARIRGSLSPLRKQRLPLLPALATLFEGEPRSPRFARMVTPNCA